MIDVTCRVSEPLLVEWDLEQEPIDPSQLSATRRNAMPRNATLPFANIDGRAPVVPAEERPRPPSEKRFSNV
jgi:hypothetical protein